MNGSESCSTLSMGLKLIAGWLSGSDVYNSTWLKMKFGGLTVGSMWDNDFPYMHAIKWKTITLIMQKKEMEGQLLLFSFLVCICQCNMKWHLQSLGSELVWILFYYIFGLLCVCVMCLFVHTCMCSCVCSCVCVCVCVCIPILTYSVHVSSY